MIIGAVVAVALGLTPVKESAEPQLVNFDAAKIAAQVGRYQQYAGKDGKTHVRGFDQLGRGYDLTIDANGHVEGTAGDLYVTFNVKDAA
jgi:hypothetical protein